MRVSREKAAENRARVVATASRLFRQKGFDGIGVADLMNEAGLTHGGFYGQFESKEQLAVEASRLQHDASAAKWRATVDANPKHPLAALIDQYLSKRHCDELGGCMFAALAADAARQGDAVRATFTDGLEALLAVLVDVAPGRTKAARRRAAIATMAQLVGTVMLARAVDDRALAEEIRSSSAAALKAAS
jgi:TetR/AcrR family transcriptional regulator, transcriptional repressor for nem operon